MGITDIRGEIVTNSEKQRSRFGLWIDQRGIKQQWIAIRSGLSRGTISQLAMNDNRSPTVKNANKIIQILREIDPNVNQSDFWGI